MDSSFTKYLYILIMFGVAFIAMYNNLTAQIGFGLVLGVQTIYTLVFLFEIFRDFARHLKALTLTFPKTTFSDKNDVSIPLYWAICPGIILQFVASLLTIMSTSFLHGKYNSIKLSREGRWNLSTYKWMFVVSTLSLLGLTYSYTNDFTSSATLIHFSGAYKSLLFVFFILSIILPVINVINANKLSKVIVSSTDG